MQKKIHSTSNQIALFALCLSVLSSGFGIYQRWSSEEDEHVKAAIDLSDTIPPRFHAAMMATRTSGDSGS